MSFVFQCYTSPPHPLYPPTETDKEKGGYGGHMRMRTRPLNNCLLINVPVLEFTKKLPSYSSPNLLLVAPPLVLAISSLPVHDYHFFCLLFLWGLMRGERVSTHWTRCQRPQPWRLFWYFPFLISPEGSP